MARWAVFTEVAVGTQFICVRFAGFFKYQILRQMLALRFWVMLTVTITPNISKEPDSVKAWYGFVRLRVGCQSWLFRRSLHVHVLANQSL